MKKLSFCKNGDSKFDYKKSAFFLNAIYKSGQTINNFFDSKRSRDITHKKCLGNKPMMKKHIKNPHFITVRSMGMFDAILKNLGHTYKGLWKNVV